MILCFCIATFRRAISTMVKDRSAFDNAFVKNLKQIQEELETTWVRTSASITTMNCKEHIQDKSEFRHAVFGELHGVLYDHNLCPAGKDVGQLTAQDWLDHQCLHLHTTLFITGPSRMGKTEFLKHIGFAQTLKYSGEKARMVILRTIDKIKDFEFERGQTLFLDEQNPADASQTIYSSAGMWLSVLEPDKSVNIRCRNKDASICPGVIRIVGATNQYTTAEQFASSFCANPEQTTGVHTPLINSQ